jgi:FlaA1/EpsC-like NDP-sugar epimerase
MPTRHPRRRHPAAREATVLSLDHELERRLLGRDVSAVLEADDRLRLQGQRALVTCAAGSVGFELCRQLAVCGVSRLTVMDHSEYGLFRMEGELRRSYPSLTIVPVLGDVTRRADLRQAMTAAEPHVVYHAAAYKHVTFAESAIVQALRVNALGAAATARAARDAGARFVLISSDKAAEPRSVMGATKRFAELTVLGMASAAFRPVVVRFGNILGSSGSVAEILLDRAMAGMRLPITDPDATRYFMTAAEAVSLVLKADLIGVRPEVFWLDMGEPIRIGDLAARIAEHAGLIGCTPRGIDIIGLRAGEKRHEELTTQGLAMRRTAHSRIFSARQKPVAPGAIRAAMRRAQRACASGDVSEALDTLTNLVADFEPSIAARERAAAHAAARVRQVSAA